jgi:hypothetical protein
MATYVVLTRLTPEAVKTPGELIRSYGHGQTETWTAMPWERFEIVLPA